MIANLVETAVEEDIAEIQDLHLEFPVTTVAEVATLLGNVASLIRPATLVERLVTSAENVTKMIAELIVINAENLAICPEIALEKEKGMIENATHVAILATSAEIALLVEFQLIMMKPSVTVVTKKDTSHATAVQTDLINVIHVAKLGTLPANAR